MLRKSKRGTVRTFTRQTRCPDLLADETLPRLSTPPQDAANAAQQLAEAISGPRWAPVPADGYSGGRTYVDTNPPASNWGGLNSINIGPNSGGQNTGNTPPPDWTGYRPVTTGSNGAGSSDSVPIFGAVGGGGGAGSIVANQPNAQNTYQQSQPGQGGAGAGFRASGGSRPNVNSVSGALANSGPQRQKTRPPGFLAISDTGGLCSNKALLPALIAFAAVDGVLVLGFIVAFTVWIVKRKGNARDRRAKSYPKGRYREPVED